jgi:hypothetical protein
MNMDMTLLTFQVVVVIVVCGGDDGVTYDT